MPDDIVDAGQTTCYSARSAVSGRTLAARRAGSRDAARRLTPMVLLARFARRQILLLGVLRPLVGCLRAESRRRQASVNRGAVDAACGDCRKASGVIPYQRLKAR